VGAGVVVSAEIDTAPGATTVILALVIFVAITAGKLDFGPGEQIFYGEFDGRRAKRVLVKVIGE